MSKSSRTKVLVTPIMAQEYLDSRKPPQRSTPARHIEELANAMQFGRWKYNGESLKFDKNYNMIDGQNRCLACIKSGKSFDTDIVYGLDNSAYLTIDLKAKPRSASDVLYMEGEKNTRTLASGLAWLYAYKNKAILLGGKTYWISPDVQQLKKVLDLNPAIRESVLVAEKCKHLMGTGPLTFLHYLFSKKDNDTAAVFFEQFGTGEGLSKGNPILFLRQRLLNDKINNKAKLPIGDKIASIVNSWNLIRLGKKAKSVSSIRWTTGGLYPQKFPVAI